MSLHLLKLQFESKKYRITPLLCNTVLMFFLQLKTQTLSLITVLQIPDTISML